MPVVIDDRLLFDCLAEQPPAAIVGQLTESGVFTTSYWYYRLGRAVVGGSGAGALSGPMARLDAESRQRVRSRLDALPLDWTVWPRFPWLVKTPEGTWGPSSHEPRLPLSFSVLASRPTNAAATE